MQFRSKLLICHTCASQLNLDDKVITSIEIGINVKYRFAEWRTSRRAEKKDKEFSSFGRGKNMPEEQKGRDSLSLVESGGEE